MIFITKDKTRKMAERRVLFDIPETNEMVSMFLFSIEIQKLDTVFIIRSTLW